jgi:MFS family permease
LIEGIAEATSSLLKLFSGVVMDRTRRARPWMLVGYGLAGIGRPLIAFISSWPWLLLIRFSDRVGKGLRSSPRDALLAASVGPRERGLAFGLHRAMDNAGAVIGPLLAAALLAAQVPLRQIFLWSAVPAALCVALTFCLRETPVAVAPRPRLDWRLRQMPLSLRRYLVVLAVFTLGNASNLFLLLRARELGVPAVQVPLLWAAVSAVAMLFSTPLAALSDRVGRVRVLLGGYLAYAVFYLFMGLTTHAGISLTLLFAFYGLFMAATEGVEKALVADLAPDGRGGTAFGWFHLTTGATLLPASLLFGWLYESVSPLAAFAFSASCASLALLLLWRWIGTAPLRPAGGPGDD